MTKSNFKKSYDVITIMSPKNITKITSQFFSNLSLSKFLATPALYRVFQKKYISIIEIHYFFGPYMP